MPAPRRSATRTFGHYAGGQAEYARVPYADFGPMKVPDGLDDEQVLFLSDIFPTGYMAAENCEDRAGRHRRRMGMRPRRPVRDRSAFMLGAAQVIAIDRHVTRLALAQHAGAVTLNYETTSDVVEALKDMTAGRGPERCIEAVGMEAHGTSLYGKFERAKQALKLELDNATALRQIFQACGKGGTVSVVGVYAGHI